MSSETGVALAPIDLYAAEWRASHQAHCRSDPDPDSWTATCLADRRTALADFTQAVVEAPSVAGVAGLAASELLPALADCAAPVNYRALVSEAPRDVRARAWHLRLVNASAFGPRPTTRETAFPPDPELARRFVTTVPSAADPRATLDAWFSLLVAGLQGPLLPARDSLVDAVALGRRAAESGHADIAARAWVLAAELLEAGPHADDAREEAWVGAAAALASLPAAHRLRLRLRRDLAYIELAHARHAVPSGACAHSPSEACRPLAVALADLAAVAAAPSATSGDVELLARAHDHAGDAMAAAAVRAGAAPLCVEERELGFLDFPALDARP